MIGEISKSFSHMATAVASRTAANPPPAEPEDEHSLWAKIMAMRLRQADPYRAAKFKVDVDTMALDLLRPSGTEKE